MSISYELIVSIAIVMAAGKCEKLRKPYYCQCQEILEIEERKKNGCQKQSHRSFLAGLERYENRLDKGYRLTDCISMNTMHQLRSTEVLTHDKHFVQEGFMILFPD